MHTPVGKNAFLISNGLRAFALLISIESGAASCFRYPGGDLLRVSVRYLCCQATCANDHCNTRQLRTDDVRDWTKALGLPIPNRRFSPPPPYNYGSAHQFPPTLLKTVYTAVSAGSFIVRSLRQSVVQGERAVE